MFKLYFKNAFGSIYYDKERRLGKAVWSGYIHGAEFREATLLCLDLVDKYELRGWLGDNRKMNSIAPSDLQWSLEVFIPQVVSSPLLRMANLPSESAENRKAISIMLQKKNELDQRLIMQDFESEEEAMAWLLEIADHGS